MSGTGVVSDGVRGKMREGILGEIWEWLGSHGKLMGAETSLVCDFLYQMEPGLGWD